MKRTLRRSMSSLGAIVVLATSLTGCTESDGDAAGSTAPSPIDTHAEGAASTATEPPGTGACDTTDDAACLLPWPSDRYTRLDATTTTGRRLDLPADGTPKNASGKPIDPTEWNRNDGFSPASNLIVQIDELDIAASELPPVTDIGASLSADSALVLFDTTSGDRVAAWAEMDSNNDDVTTQPLIIVPAAGLLEGHRYVVALRNLKSAAGDIEPEAAFSDLLTDPDEQTDALIDSVKASGAAIDEVDIAWQFTIASSDSLSGRLQHMAAETLAGWGDGAPEFTVDSVTESGPAKVVEGTFTMPKYLSGDGATGSILNNGDDPNGIPTVDGTMTAKFTCVVPISVTADDPAEMIVYGHGLLGTRSEVTGIGTTAAVVNIGMCATDFLGMTAEDIPTLAKEFADFSEFRTQPDRMQQGHLAFLALGRLLRSKDGFATNAAFQKDGAPVIDTTKLTYLGASQGGILGAAPSAVTNDWGRVVLAVGGMGYNLLLRRSVDFDDFVGAFETAYPNQLDQAIVLEMAESLWDRGENAGYAQHVRTNPYDGITAKSVVALEAFGDHQVANVSTEKLARTLGIGRRIPTSADGRSTSPEPYFGIKPIDDLTGVDSALWVWDFGSPPPPDSNQPPREGDDPHGDLGDDLSALTLLASYVNDGSLPNVCGDTACTG